MISLSETEFFLEDRPTSIALAVVKWIKHLPPKKLKDWEPRSASHFSGRWKLGVARLVTKPDLRRPYAAIFRCKFQGHDSQFLYSSCVEAVVDATMSFPL